MIVLFMLSPIFNVKEIKVEGIQKISREEIVNLSKINIGENTFKIKNTIVTDGIKSHTYVEKVNIKRELPNAIKITIKERTPQYIIQIAEENAYIDLNGYILEISAENLDLPKIVGYKTDDNNIIDFQNTKKLAEDDCRVLETVGQIIKNAKTNDIYKYITSIDISDESDIKLNLASENKIAHLGDGTNANFRILYTKIMIEKESGKEGEIFVNGNVTTLKPKPYFREKV